MHSHMSCLFVVMAIVVAVKGSLTSTTVSTLKNESLFVTVVTDHNALIYIIGTVCGLIAIIVGVCYCCYKKRKNGNKSLKSEETDESIECNDELFKPDVKPNFDVQYMKEQETLYDIDLNINSSENVNGQTQLIQTQPTFTSMDL
eukprot:97145_1